MSTNTNQEGNMKKTMRQIETVAAGAIILPPARERSLWMERHLAENNLPAEALHLTVREIYEGAADKKGRWIVVKCNHSAAWLKGRPEYSFNFKARPHTMWAVIG